jgi:hypothetical protein
MHDPSPPPPPISQDVCTVNTSDIFLCEVSKKVKPYFVLVEAPRKHSPFLMVLNLQFIAIMNSNTIGVCDMKTKEQFLCSHTF